MFPLIEVLKTPCIATQVWAARLLGRQGPGAAAALPGLRKLCRAKSPAVRKTARQAIRQIESGPTPGSTADPGGPTPPRSKGRWARFTIALRAALGAVHR